MEATHLDFQHEPSTSSYASNFKRKNYESQNCHNAKRIKTVELGQGL